jgi:hypothetical protein
VSGQKHYSRFPVATVAENGSISVDSARPVFEALVILPDTAMIFRSNMQKIKPSDKLGMKRNFMPASHKNSALKN